MSCAPCIGRHAISEHLSAIRLLFDAGKSLSFSSGRWVQVVERFPEVHTPIWGAFQVTQAFADLRSSAIPKTTGYLPVRCTTSFSFS